MRNDQQPGTGLGRFLEKRRGNASLRLVFEQACAIDDCRPVAGRLDEFIGFLRTYRSSREQKREVGLNRGTAERVHVNSLAVLFTKIALATCREGFDRDIG